MAERRGGAIDWIVSYPKSGSTWMRLMLENCLDPGGGPLDINRLGVTRGTSGARWLIDEQLGIASSDLLPAERLSLMPEAFRLAAERADEPLMFKVHDRQQRLTDGRWLFPEAPSRVAIYLVRNPLDVAVSLAFHLGYGDDFDRAIALINDPDAAIGGRGERQGAQVLGSWSGHVSSWLYGQPIPVRVVRYEDMLADPMVALASVVDALGNGLPVAPERLHSAVEQTDLARLQAQEAAAGFAEAPRRDQPFFRSGRSGEGRERLTAKQVQRVIDAHGDAMRRFGYLGPDGELI